MRRGAKIAAWAVGIPIVLVVVLLAVVLIGANTGPGRRLIEALAPRLTGGEVAVEGLSGHLPDALRAAHVEIRDRSGAWLKIDDLALDWSPLKLLSKTVKVEDLTASHVAVLRLPQSSGSSSSSSPTLHIAVDHFAFARLDIAPPVAGKPATIRLAGGLTLASMEEGSVDLEAARLDGPGSYHLTGKISPTTLQADVVATEPAHGLIAGLAGLPDLGALSIDASLAGPRTAEKTQLKLRAGPLHADGQGTIDLVNRTVDLDLTAGAPAMSPRPDVSWKSVALTAHVHGPFTRPNATGHLEIDAITTSGGGIGRVTADVTGSSGKLDLTAAVEGLRLPGPKPDLFGTAPLQFQVAANLDSPTRPISFTVSHPLLHIAGQAESAGAAIGGTAKITLPDLAPFAAMQGIALQGHAALDAKLSLQGSAIDVALTGATGLTGGLPVAVALVGSDAKLDIAAVLSGQDVTLDHARVDGKAIQISVAGTDKAGALDFTWQLGLSDLSRLAPTIAGALTAKGTLKGQPSDLALNADASGQLGGPGVPKGPISLSLTAQGLPSAPSGRVTAQGRLAGAPIQLAAAVKRDPAGALQISIERAQWKSASAQGNLLLAPGALVPTGRLQLRMTRLAELAPIIGQAVSGSLAASLDTVTAGGKPQARVQLQAQQLAFAGNQVARVTLGGTIADPTARPVVALQLALDGIAANGVTGSARLTANGPQTALGLRLSADLQTSAGAARLAAAATAALPQRQLTVSSLQANYAGETARLLGPTRITLADGLAIDGLRLGVGQAVLTASGRVSPTLGLTVAVRNVTPALAKPFAPSLQAEGSLALEARLGGTLAAPSGTIRLTGRRLRMRSGPGGAIPAANVDATAILGGGAARVDASVAAGSSVHLRLTGTAPLRGATALNLHAAGTVNLAVINPLLAANGRNLRGQVNLDIGVAGTLQAPRATGTIRLAAGDFQDYVQGVHLTDLTGLIQANGAALRIVRLTGHAGQGNVSVAGTIGALEPGIPVDLTIDARNARPLASDLLTADLDAALTVRGRVTGALTLGGHVQVRRANINIPDSFPTSVAVLNVRRPGQKPPPPAALGPTLALALTVDAPEQVFVRGHGLDAELGGRLVIGGSSAAPQINGGFNLRHGTFSLAGQNLTFNSGTITFNGAGLSRKLDPALNFVAESTANSITATLTVTGYADAPKIALTSSPPLPQDEVLSQLLFGQSVKQLSPFQLAEIAQALASLGGVGGGDPLASVRKGLGLDRLSVGSGTTGGASVEAGKYVANGVYVGAKQGTGGGTQAQVQIDLTKHLKLESTLGTGNGTPATGVTPDNDPGSSLGITYQFDY